MRFKNRRKHEARETRRYRKRAECAGPEKIKQAREFQEAANDQRRISVSEITIYPQETEGYRWASFLREGRPGIERRVATRSFIERGENTLDGSSILFERLNEYGRRGVCLSRKLP